MNLANLKETALSPEGYLVLFAWVFAEQIGLPLPAAPVLIAAGALAGADLFRVMPPLIIAIIASTVADCLWYFGGRSDKPFVQRLLERRPRTKLRDAVDYMLTHFTGGALLIAKFIPGVSTVVPALCGAVRVSQRRFLIMDILGSAAWAGAFVGLGHLLGQEVPELPTDILEWAGVVAIVLIVFTAFASIRKRAANAAQPIRLLPERPRVSKRVRALPAMVPVEFGE
jgi:membrane protein DedA with SNARE-associated domain